MSSIEPTSNEFQNSMFSYRDAGCENHIERIEAVQKKSFDLLTDLTREKRVEGPDFSNMSFDFLSQSDEMFPKRQKIEAAVVLPVSDYKNPYTELGTAFSVYRTFGSEDSLDGFINKDEAVDQVCEGQEIQSVPAPLPTELGASSSADYEKTHAVAIKAWQIVQWKGLKTERLVDDNSPEKSASVYKKRPAWIRFLWTKEEDAVLANAVSEGLDWPKVALRLKGRHTAASCYAKWSRIRKDDNSPEKSASEYKQRPAWIKSLWTKEEDAVLANAVSEGLAWPKVALILKEKHTAVACYTRWARIRKDDNSPEKSALEHKKVSVWSKEEDDRLIEIVRGGCVVWSEVAAKVGGSRSSFGCYARWTRIRNHLLR